MDGVIAPALVSEWLCCVILLCWGFGMEIWVLSGPVSASESACAVMCVLDEKGMYWWCVVLVSYGKRGQAVYHR